MGTTGTSSPVVPLSCVSTVARRGLVGHIPGRFLAFVTAQGYVAKIGPEMTALRVKVAG